jgi:hypothetical protein
LRDQGVLVGVRHRHRNSRELLEGRELIVPDVVAIAFREPSTKKACDEAYIDITESPEGILSATQIAEEIRARSRAEIELTASVGVL